MLGDHRDSVVEVYDLTDALDRQCRAVVDMGELAAENRASRDCGDLHAGNFDIDAELRLAINLVGGIETLGRRSDQLKILSLKNSSGGEIELAGAT
jgi:hypothetical protein